MTEEQELAPVETPESTELIFASTVDDIIAQQSEIRRLMTTCMRDKTHYGVPFKTNNPEVKPVLYQSGAHLLMRMFKLKPSFEVVSSVRKFDNTVGHWLIAYCVKCVLVHWPSGQQVGEGMGSCNSAEVKYARQLDQRQRIAWDLDNTLLKMAQKRAKVAAVLSATAADDLFTQDMEDDPALWDQHTGFDERKKRRPDYQRGSKADQAAKVTEDIQNGKQST